MRYRLLDTPTGPFAILQQEDGRVCTRWIGEDGPPDGRRDDGLRPDVAEPLERYFAGETVEFADLDLADLGHPGNGFRERCWTACRAIPRGRTRTYTELARLAGGADGSARAAGQSMRHNPLPIIVPCHRVLAAGGQLGGFGGSVDPGGRQLATKRWLLTLEGALTQEDRLWTEPAVPTV
jgi:methylated-DNA-[protein]-cysteine S-methyltransferase